MEVVMVDELFEKLEDTVWVKEEPVWLAELLGEVFI
jgi:hypothetical protein